MGIFGLILAMIGIVAMIALIYVIIYNTIQFYITKIERVEGLIDNDLRNKFDIIKRADDVIKKNLKANKDYLKDYCKLKEEKISNFDLERKLKEAENLIYNLYNDHLELNKSENMIEIKKDFKEVNEKLVAGISYYNKETSELNSYIRKFPNNLIAKIHHISPKTFFDGKDMTDTEINDFKL